MHSPLILPPLHTHAGAQALAAFLESNRSLVFLDLSAASISYVYVYVYLCT